MSEITAGTRGSCACCGRPASTRSTARRRSWPGTIDCGGTARGRRRAGGRPRPGVRHRRRPRTSVTVAFVLGDLHSVGADRRSSIGIDRRRSTSCSRHLIAELGAARRARVELEARFDPLEAAIDVAAAGARAAADLGRAARVAAGQTCARPNVRWSSPDPASSRRGRWPTSTRWRPRPTSACSTPGARRGSSTGAAATTGRPSASRPAISSSAACPRATSSCSSASMPTSSTWPRWPTDPPSRSPRGARAAGRAVVASPRRRRHARAAGPVGGGHPDRVGEAPTRRWPRRRSPAPYGQALGADGFVAADPGVAGYWVARTFATTALGGAKVPARRSERGFAIAASVVARLRRPGRRVLAVADAPARRARRASSSPRLSGWARRSRSSSGISTGRSIDADAHAAADPRARRRGSLGHALAGHRPLPARRHDRGGGGDHRVGRPRRATVGARSMDRRP